MNSVNQSSTSRRARAAHLAGRLLFRAVTHVGQETEVSQTLERTIRRVEPESGTALVTEAIAAAIAQAERRIADNQSEIDELKVGISRLKYFSRRYGSGLKLVKR